MQLLILIIMPIPSLQINSAMGLLQFKANNAGKLGEIEAPRVTEEQELGTDPGEEVYMYFQCKLLDLSGWIISF